MNVPWQTFAGTAPAPTWKADSSATARMVTLRVLCSTAKTWMNVRRWATSALSAVTTSLDHSGASVLTVTPWPQMAVTVKVSPSSFQLQSNTV